MVELLPDSDGPLDPVAVCFPESPMLNRLLLTLAVLLAVAVLPALGQGRPAVPFEIVFDPSRDVQEEGGTGKGLQFTVSFKVIRHKGASEGKDYKIVIEEDGREVARLEVPPPAKANEDLSAVLAIDISGSMEKDIPGLQKDKKRIDQARVAATSFVQRLPGKAECGLILFDHEIRPDETVRPTFDRGPLVKIIRDMEPRGGTAYLKATKQGIEMLAGLKTNKSNQRKKAVVIMTDGVDLNSEREPKYKERLEDIIQLAREKKVQVYTIGIGEPGTGRPVISMLVLDHSQSMELPADNVDTRPKIEALHKAATRFVTIMPTHARTSVLAFGSTVDTPSEFSNDAVRLKKIIEGLTPKGETAMLDAAYDAVATLAAHPTDGHRAVVVMTDGIDNTSRRRPEDVIQRAKEANISLHMLALGRESEMKQAKPDMQRMAKETGGTFHHARNEKDLIRIFEDMSMALHDDGIDVASLTNLAKQTGGRYYHARDIKSLKLMLDEVSKDLQQEKPYQHTFTSARGFDGTVHRIAVKLVHEISVVDNKTGETKIVDETIKQVEADRSVRGVVVAEMNPFVYLGFLGILGLLLAVPMTLGRVWRSLS
jgi:VWFA-related protein